jgi:hypothetical protein
MRTGISIEVSPVSRARLDAIVADRNSPQKHVWRARIVLLSADGAGTAEIMRTAGVSKTAVWRWQERFMQEGVDGLQRDKTRPSRIPPLGPEIAERAGFERRANAKDRPIADVARISIRARPRNWLTRKQRAYSFLVNRI